MAATLVFAGVVATAARLLAAPANTHDVLFGSAMIAGAAVWALVRRLREDEL